MPKKIDRYEIRDMLGTGAMGAVYLAWDPKLHREVAVKVLRQDLADKPKVRERFRREARAVAALRHPNIIEIYDYSGEDSEHLYIVMERLEGDDLFNIVARSGTMPEAVVAAIGHELCLALQVAHDAGIIHRDLKPENIFISPNGRIVLTDFGIVKAVKENSAVDGFEASTDIIGTPGFMPPELMMNKELGPYSDVFGLGALLYNIATGHLPYTGIGPVEIFKAITSGIFPDARKYNRMLSEGLCEVFEKSLEPKVPKRAQGVDELREILRECLALEGVTDLRDDIREYMADPSAFRVRALDRSAHQLLSNIEISLKDKDYDRADAMRDRLMLVQPENEAIHAVTGMRRLSDFPEELLGTPESWASAAASNYDPGTDPGPAKGGGRLGWVVATLAFIAIAVAAILILRPNPDAPKHTAQGLAADASGNPKMELEPTGTAVTSAEVKIYFKGGAGTLLVDGKKVGKFKKRKILTMEAGNHTIEVRGRRKNAKKSISVVAGAPMVFSVDVKRGVIARK